MSLWPDRALVFAGVEQSVARLGLPSNITGITYAFGLQHYLAAARVLVPNLKAVAIVGDPLVRQSNRRHFIDQLPKLTSDLRIFDLTGLPLAQVKQRVSNLPADTAVLYTAIYDDGTGTAYTPRDALAAVSESSNRPIVTDVESFIDERGATGGYVVAPGPIGHQLALRTLRILGGERASMIPIEPGDVFKPVFDGRELRRFGISEDRLPSGSDIRFRIPTLWEQYFWLLIGVFAAIAVQSLLISGLLVERHRRRAVEAELRNRLLEVVHLNRIATAASLSTSIAHELNQPLGAILGNAETAEVLLDANSPDVAQLKEIIGDIRRDNQRASDVIRHLRGLLKRGNPELQELDLRDTVQSTLSILDPEAAKRGVQLKQIQILRALPVRADPVHLQQVILNLAMNGMDAMQNAAGERTMIIETAQSGATMAEVSVADSGSGIPADKLKSIFETFYTTKPQGTGLGLSIARTIVETYGGRIWAENRLAGGAVFRFTLPLAKGGTA
jgi:signal transduction histidine kinase